MEKAYQEALDKYLAEHPEHKDMQLKNDPKKMLEDIIKKAEASKKARELQEARMRELQQQQQALAQGQGGLAAAGNPQAHLQHQQNAAQLAQIRAQILQNQAYDAGIRANPMMNPFLAQQPRAARPIGPIGPVGVNRAFRHGHPVVRHENPVQWQQAAAAAVPRHAQPNPNNQ